MRARLPCRRSCKRGLDFIVRQRFWQNLPLARGLDVQRGIVLDGFVQQEIPIKMTQSGKFPSHAAPVHLMGKKLLQKFADVIAARGKQDALSFLQKLGKLPDVGRVSGNG